MEVEYYRKKDTLAKLIVAGIPIIIIVLGFCFGNVLNKISKGINFTFYLLILMFIPYLIFVVIFFLGIYIINPEVVGIEDSIIYWKKMSRIIELDLDGVRRIKVGSMYNIPSNYIFYLRNGKIKLTMTFFSEKDRKEYFYILRRIAYYKGIKIDILNHKSA